MELNLFTILIALMLAVWIIQAIGIALSERSFSWKTGLNFLASACLITGATGFFGTALSAAGGLNWLPSSFEWPVGSAENVLVTADGSHIVPLTPSGRIQIYSRDRKFERGWTVDAGGGTFKLLPAGKNDVFVYTARGSMKYHYDIYGRLLSSEKYDPQGYSDLEKAGIIVEIPTPFYLMVFTHPFAAWLAAAAGMLLLYIISRMKHGKTGKVNPAAF